MPEIERGVREQREAELARDCSDGDHDRANSIRAHVVDYSCLPGILVCGLGDVRQTPHQWFRR